MARLSHSDPVVPDHSKINLTRLVSRLQSTLLEPDSDTAHRLRTSAFERTRVGGNLEHAKSILHRLEQEYNQSKNPTRRQELQSIVSQRQAQLRILDNRLHELNATGQQYDDEPPSDSEDLLGGYTPSESTDDPHPTITSGPGSASTDDDDDEELKAILAERAAAAAEAAKPSPTPKSARDELFPSALRARNANVTLSVPTQDTAQTTASSTSAPLTDALMTHHRTEQEALTESLVQMAKALKESSKNFSLSLEEEKEIVARAGEGLDRNTSGLEQASRRIGYLRRMSEGKGWWGRIMLYVWIAGLAFLAFFIVAFMPKLRF